MILERDVGDDRNANRVFMVQRDRDADSGLNIESPHPLPAASVGVTTHASFVKGNASVGACTPRKAVTVSLPFSLLAR